MDRWWRAAGHLNMLRKFYDLSMPVDPNSGTVHPPMIEYSDHGAGARRMAPLFGVSPSDMPDGMGSAMEVLHLRTHTGAHMDAPYHYYPTTAGMPARRIDEIPLEWCMGPGVVLDFHDRPPGHAIPTSELRDALDRIDHELAPGDIVLVRTDAYRHFREPDFPDSGPGVTAEATRWLIGEGIRVMGIDAWSWDIPLRLQGEAFRRNGDPEVLWAAHRVGKDLEFCILEQLGHLDALPSSTGFTVCVFPVKVMGAGAGWTRAVAIYEEGSG